MIVGGYQASSIYEASRNKEKTKKPKNDFLKAKIIMIIRKNRLYTQRSIHFREFLLLLGNSSSSMFIFPNSPNGSFTQSKRSRTKKNGKREEKEVNKQ